MLTQRAMQRAVSLFLVVLGLVCALAGVASAATVEPKASAVVDGEIAKIGKLEAQRATLEADRRAAETTYQAKTAEIARLKAKPSSWSRDRKLQQLLRESKDMATALDRKEELVRAVDAELAAERKALLAAVDAELAAQPGPDAARRAKLEKTRAALAGSRGVHKIRVADETIDPLDDPEDLDDKAGALQQTEKQLLDEEARLSRRAGYYRKQAKLAKAHARAEEQDVFHDERPRRGGGTRASAADADPSGMETGGNNPTDGVTQPPPAGSADDGGLTGTPESPAPVDVGGSDTAGDPATVLADVVDADTLNELRKAERSGDPESRAKAAERAAKEVHERAEKIRKRREEMERRAKLLRQQ